jgi:hypothetical protein
MYPKRFKALDLYNTDNLFRDEEKLIRDSVREWVDEQVLLIISSNTDG